jgi:hypothetical protein
MYTSAIATSADHRTPPIATIEIFFTHTRAAPNSWFGEYGERIPSNYAKPRGLSLSEHLFSNTVANLFN